MDPRTTPPTAGPSVPVRAIPRKELTLPGSRTRRFDGGSFGSAISYFAVDNDPGDTVALHRHPYTETWVVLEGHVHFTVGAAVLGGTAGDTVVAPARVWHGFTNDGDGPLRMMCIHASPASSRNGRTVQYCPAWTSNSGGTASCRRPGTG